MIRTQSVDLKLMARLAMSLCIVITVVSRLFASVSVTQTGIEYFDDSAVVQPGPGYAEDCIIQYGGSWDDYNNGQSPCISVGAYDHRTILRTLMKFPLAQKISADQIKSAKIVLSVRGWQKKDIDSLFTINVHAMLRSWKSGNASVSCYEKALNSPVIDGATGLERFWGKQDGTEDWNAPHVGMDDVDASKSPVSTVSKNYPDQSSWEFDITSLYKSWLAGESENFGILLRSPQDQGEYPNYSYPLFWSGDNELYPGKRPKLVIEYEPNSKALIAEYLFNEGAGDEIFDSSGNEHHGRIYGAVWTDGIRGAALSFDGSHYAEIPDSPSLDGMNALTLEAWVKLADTTSSGAIICKWGNGGQSDDSYAMRLYGNKWGIQISGDAGENKSNRSNTSLIQNKWYYLASVYTGDSIKLYTNGELSFETAANCGAINNTAEPVLFGQGTEPGFEFSGVIDDVRISGYSLLPEEIKSRYEASEPSDSSKKLIAHWSFDSISTAKLYDVSGNGYDATYADLKMVDGIIGKALECSGNDFDIEVASSAANFNVPHYTIEGWVCSNVDMVNPGSFWNYKKVFDFTGTGLSGSDEAYGYGLQITGEGKLELGMDNENGADSWVWVTANTVMHPGVWYHVAASYNGSMLAIYVNGELENTLSYTGGYASWNNNARIGCMRMTNGTLRNWFNGKIDELKLYDYALDPETVRAHYLANKPEQDAPFEINFGLKTVYAQPGDELWAPIFLTNYEDYAISACQFALSFDTTIVEYVDFSVDSGIAKDWMVMTNDEAGNRVLFGMGGEQQPLTYGEGELVRCLLRVKPTAPEDAYTDLTLSDIVIDEDNNLIIATSTPGKIMIQQVDVLYGDVTGNETVNIFDAQKILQYVVGALRLPDETVPNFTAAVADVSGNGTISSYDAALVFQHSVGLLPTFPVEQQALTKSREQSSKAYLSLVPDEPEDDALSFHLTGENLKGFVAGEFAISYNPDKINLAVGEIETAVRGATLKAQLDSEEHMLKVAVTTNDDIDESGEVRLLTITVPVQDPQTASSLSLAKALLNEGKIQTNIVAEGIVEETSVKKAFMPAKSNRVSFVRNGIMIANAANARITATLYSVSGRKILEQHFSEAQRIALVDTRRLPQGVYICRIRIGDALLSRPLVIRQ